ncbi:hypothetical protein ACFX12_041576 [Malus domestica]
MPNLTRRRGCTRMVASSLTRWVWPPTRMSLKGFNWLRSSMLIFLLFGIQTAVTGKGPISFLLTFNR